MTIKMTTITKIKDVSINTLKLGSILGSIYFVGDYIYNENSTKKHDISDIRQKINRIICDNKIEKLNPEDIYALQFTKEKREYYKRYVTYPGNIITGVLFPISFFTLIGGMCTFNTALIIIGYCTGKSAFESNIVNNKISKNLNKGNLIIDEKDFLNIDQINYCHKIDTFDIEGHYTYSRQDALREKKLERLYA